MATRIENQLGSFESGSIVHETFSSQVSHLNVLRRSIFPLTEPSTDLKGNTIQLWAIPGAKAIGVAKRQDGSLRYITSDRISNPLNPKENATELFHRLLFAQGNTWDYAFQENGCIAIWPRLVAAGWEDALPRYNGDSSGLTRLARGRTQEQMCAWFYSNGYRVTERKIDVRLELTLNGENVGTYNSHDHSTIHNLLRQGAVISTIHHPPPTANELKRGYMGRGLEFSHPNDSRQTKFNIDLTRVDIKSWGKGVPEEEAGYHIDIRSELNSQKVRVSTKETYQTNYQARKEGKKPPFILKAGHPTTSHVRLKTIVGKQFQETVQRYNLTQSYNSCHPKSLMPPKPHSNGQIGGVAAGAGKIKGLFADGKELSYDKHIFAFHAIDGKPPFSQENLQRLLRELAIGIYMHDAIPFFSLDFNGDSNLVPVLHPVYENTLVGKVISLLDYYMKGYLNGGLFNEDFIKKWQENNEKIGEDHLSSIIDLHKYIRDLTTDDISYLSLRQLLIGLQLEKDAKDIPPLAEECYHTRTSFRIIANQNGLEKHDNFFIPDPDFNVFYTIETDSAFKDKVDSHSTQHGQDPKGLKDLDSACKIMAKRIKSQMPKLPICRELFQMLNMISFFTHYFTTLKAKGKVPDFDEIQTTPTSVATLYPPFPLRTAMQQTATIYFDQFYLDLDDNARTKIFDWLFSTDDVSLSPELIDIAAKTLVEHIARKFLKPLARVWRSDENYEVVKENVQYLLQTVKEHAKRNSLKPKNSSIPKKFIKKNLSIPFEMPPFRKQVLALATEIEVRERVAIQRVVGGCGLRFSKVSCSTSHHAKQIFEINHALFSEMPHETWQEVTSHQEGIVNHFAFSLSFYDFPASENEDFSVVLESSLTSASQSSLWYDVIKEIDAENINVDAIQAMQGTNEEWNSRDAKGLTLLHIAAARNMPDVCGIFLQKGVSAVAKDVYGLTAVHYASANGHNNVLEKLLLISPELVNSVDIHGGTPLHAAVRHGHLVCVQTLLQHGAYINAKAHHDLTPLATAFHHEQWEIATLLINQPGIDLLATTQEGQSALHEAVDAKSLTMVELIISKKCPVSSSRIDGYTPFLLAIRHDQEEIAVRLLNAGASIFEALPRGETALHIAVQNGNQALSALLLERAPQLLIKRNSASQSSLQLALLRGDDAIASMHLGCIKQIMDAYHESRKTICGNIQEGLIWIFNSTGRRLAPAESAPIVEYPKYLALKVVACVRNFFPLGLFPIPSELCELLNTKDRFQMQPILAAVSTSCWGAFKRLLDLKAEVPPIDVLLPKLAQAYPPALNSLPSYAELTPEQKYQLLMLAGRSGNGFLVDEISKNYLPDDQAKALELLEICAAEMHTITARRILKRHPHLIESCFQGQGIMSLAASTGCAPLLIWALQQHKSEKAVIRAMKAACEAGQMRSVELLFEHLPNTAAPLNEKEQTGAHIAAMNGHAAIVEFFVRRYCKSNLLDIDGKDSFDHALENDHYDTIITHYNFRHKVRPESLSFAATGRLLKEVIADGEFCDQSLTNALLEYVKKDNMDCIIVLLQHGVQPDISVDGQWSAFTYAAAHGHTKALRLFLERANDFHERHTTKDALHHAVRGVHFGCIQLLLAAGYTPLQQDQDGKNCIQIALQPWLVRFLKDPKGFIEFISSIKQQLSKIAIADLKNVAEGIPLDVSFFTQNDVVCPLPLAALIALSKPTEEKVSELLETFPEAIHLQDDKGQSFAHLIARLGLLPRKEFDLTRPDSQGFSAVHIYAALGSYEILKRAMEIAPGLNLNAQSHTGSTPLYEAVLAKHEDTVKVLLELGADPNIAAKDSTTPLSVAAASGNCYILRALIEKGALVNTLKKPAFIAALQNGHEEAAFLLIQHGTKIHVLDESRHTPAHYAAETNSLGILRYLRNCGMPLYFKNSKGKMPAHFAATRGNDQALELVGRKLPAPTSPTEGQAVITPLELASFAASKPAFDTLVKQGHDPCYLEGNQTRGALAFAVRSRQYSYLEELLRTDLGKNIAHLRSAALSAVFIDDPKALSLIHKQGLVMSVPLANGKNALHWACEYGAFRVATFLLQIGVNGQEPDPSGKMPLEIAASHDHPVLLRHLLLILPLPENQEKRTLLHYASTHGCTRNVATLIEAKFDVNARDKLEYTPLHDACYRGHYSCMELLFLAGADPNLKTIGNQAATELIRMPEKEVKKKWHRLLAGGRT